MTTRKGTFTTSEVRKLLGVSRPILIKMVREGDIKCGFTRGKHRRFDRDEVERCRKLLTGVAANDVCEAT